MEQEGRSRQGQGSNRRSAPRGRGGRPGGGRPRGQWRRGFRRRQCYFCTEGIKKVDYKGADILRRFLSDRGKIKARRRTGTCARHQRQLGKAIKRARHLALLPFTSEHIRGA